MPWLADRRAVAWRGNRSLMPRGLRCFVHSLLLWSALCFPSTGRFCLAVGCPPKTDTLYFLYLFWVDASLSMGAGQRQQVRANSCVFRISFACVERFVQLLRCVVRRTFAWRHWFPFSDALVMGASTGGSRVVLVERHDQFPVDRDALRGALLYSYSPSMVKPTAARCGRASWLPPAAT